MNATPCRDCGAQPTIFVAFSILCFCANCENEEFVKRYGESFYSQDDAIVGWNLLNEVTSCEP